jgi:hypothetical protein
VQNRQDHAASRGLGVSDLTTINDFTEQGNRESRYERQGEHSADAILLLERLRQAARDGVYPSTAELQADGKYGLRPVNRLVDLRKGKYNRTRYDVERLDCGHGVYRWKLHEPNRPGYPKDKNQTVLSLGERQSVAASPDSHDWFEQSHGPRPSAVNDLPLFANSGEKA